MSDKDDLYMATLKELKTDIRQIDGKLDTMHGVLVRNTIVLEEHEKRSTLSERRIGTLEDKDQDRSIQSAKVKGFFIYSGVILSTLATIAGIIAYFLK